MQLDQSALEGNDELLTLDQPDSRWNHWALVLKDNGINASSLLQTNGINLDNIMRAGGGVRMMNFRFDLQINDSIDDIDTDGQVEW